MDTLEVIGYGIVVLLLFAAGLITYAWYTAEDEPEDEE
jgi:hypothetical protein